jgi:hypothetical protein
VVFDDTVLDKRHADKIELVRRQYSGNEHRGITGIGVVTCVYVNPQTAQFWIIDYRLYDPEGDGKSKLAHVRDMLATVVYHKELPCRAVLMDTWDATKALMLYLEQVQKLYYCPLKDKRQVDDSGGTRPYQRVDALAWSALEEAQGKTIKIKDFPRDPKVKLFRVVLSPKRTDYVVTNDQTQDSTSATQEACGWRWKIEQFHRESKQVTGLEGCQCRKARLVRTHIGCAILVWVRLKQVAHDTRQTIYQVKPGLLSDYLRQHLKSPAVKMVLA